MAKTSPLCSKITEAKILVLTGNWPLDGSVEEFLETIKGIIIQVGSIQKCAPVLIF